MGDKKINRLQFNRDKSLFITSSADFTSKLYDAVNLKHLKTYTTDRPVNDAVISETKDHILLGGGQSHVCDNYIWQGWKVRNEVFLDGLRRRIWYCEGTFRSHQCPGNQSQRKKLC